jgi:hypothetical protein
MRGSRLGAVLASGMSPSAPATNQGRAPGAQVPLTLPLGAQAHCVAASSGSPRCSELHPCSFPSATTWIPPPAAVAQNSFDWRSPSAATQFSPVTAANQSSPEVAAHRSTCTDAWADLTRAVGAGPRHCNKSSSSCGCEEREDVRRVEKSVRERRSGGAS